MKNSRILLVIIYFLNLSPAYSQHNNIWFRATLNTYLTEKTSIDVETQHRRQNSFGNNDVFNKSLMNSLRIWVNYQVNRNIKFSVSPFSCFTNYKIIQTSFDEKASPMREYRYAASIDLQHEVFKKLYIVDRTSAEFRTFQSSQDNTTRLRSRIGLRYDFNNRIKLGLFDEHLLNIKGVNNEHFFDHARQGINLEYKAFKRLKLDFGYIYIRRLPLNGAQKLSENNVFINLNYKLLDKPIFNHKTLRNHTLSHSA